MLHGGSMLHGTCFMKGNMIHEGEHASWRGTCFMEHDSWRGSCFMEERMLHGTCFIEGSVLHGTCCMEHASWRRSLTLDQEHEQKCD